MQSLSRPSPVKRLGLECVFFFVCVPVGVFFTLIGGLWGLANVALIPVGRSRVKAFGPWREVATVMTTIGRHLRYLYLFDFLPIKREFVRRRAESQAARLREIASTAPL